MLANLDKSSIFITLLMTLAYTQFGCSGLANNNAVRNPAVWSAVISAIAAGTAIRTEARQSDADIRTAKRDQQNNEVLVTFPLPIRLANGTIESKLILAYVDCRNTNDDAEILKRNNILNIDDKPFSSQEQSVLANFLRKAALPECQCKINGRCRPSSLTSSPLTLPNNSDWNKRPYLGVEIQTLTPDIKEKINKEVNINFSAVQGVLIVKVNPKSPAFIANMQAGDVIESINNQPVYTTEELQNIIIQSQIGSLLEIQINRNGETLKKIAKVISLDERLNN
ncbi:MAG: PDZ domain-containing protein [Nostoc sp.]|uniref:S1C family serine protease n=1 Tax=Nostoc sp. TaxID=1180 RepID=UPI002FF78B45